jgi:hypothetical protein
MIKTIENIYNDFYLTFENNPDYVLDFYSKNALFLNNINSFSNKEQLRQYIELLSKYVESVYLKGYYNQAIDLVDNFQAFIDNEIDRFEAHEIKNSCYYSFQFVKGMSSYKLRDYKTSNIIFRALTKIDNKNDLYNKWLSYSTYGKRLWLVNTINILCGLIIIFEMFFKSSIPNYYVRQTLLGIGLLGLLSNWGYEYYLKRNFRKKNIR